VTDAVEYLILGPLVVRSPFDVRTPTAKKERLLLIRLLIDAETVVSTDELLDALWGPRPPATARKLVQQYVGALRSRLGPRAIETVEEGYRLRAAPAEIDRNRFEHLAAEGRRLLRAGNPSLAATTLRRALDLWRGPAYLDARYEEFARIDAERLDELHLDCIDACLEAEAASGITVGAVAELQSLIAEHPHHEGFRATLMVALYRSGRQAEALKVYDDVRELLDADLGLDPGERLRTLQHQILNHDPALRARAEGEHTPRLPVPSTPLLGRADDVERLFGLVERPDVRLVTIVGAGGIGKSRLALALAHRCNGRFANGVFLAELAELRDGRHLAAALLGAVAGPASPDLPSIESLGRFLADREVLLVVDNAEHLRDVGEQLTRLIEEAPRLTVVVTSRRVLHVTGEHVYTTPPLAPATAVGLFAARAEAAAPGRQTRHDSGPVIAEICQRLDNLPLAIELAAAQSSTLTPITILERLGDRLGLLVDGPRDLPDRQRTLELTLRWSTDLLDEVERAGLARLGPFAGGCTLEAAATVAGLELTQLNTLVMHSLVNRTDVDGRPRFALLETVREYALGLLGHDRSAGERAHAAYYAGFASSYRQFLESAEFDVGARQDAWLQALDLELANLRAALDWSIAMNEPHLAVELVAGLWRYWHIRGRLAEALETIRQVLALDGIGASDLLGSALVGAAGLAWAAGHRPAATAYANEAIAAAPGDRRVALAAENVLGLIATHDRNFDAARRHHERSRTIALELGSPDQEMTAVVNLGDVAFAEGDYATATAHWLEFLDYWQARDGSEGIGLGALNLGLASLRQGRIEEAAAYFVEAQTRFERIGFRAHSGHALLGQAAAAAHRQDPERAADLFRDALTIMQEAGAAPETFDPDLAGEVEAMLREALGDEAFEQRAGPGPSVIQGR